MFKLDVDLELHKTFLSNFSHNWEMTIAERMIFLWLLQYLKPKISLEIGSRNGGSLAPLSRISEKVIVVDIDISVPERLKSIGNNIEFYIGDSADILDSVLLKLESQSSLPSFIHIDGDHTKEGAARDLDRVLKIAPTEKTFVLMHDTFNPDVRDGILSLNLNEYKYLHLAEIDFMTGVLHTRAGVVNEMWGGFSLFILDSEPRVGLLGVSNYLQKQYEIVCNEILRTSENSCQQFIDLVIGAKVNVEGDSEANADLRAGLFADEYYLDSSGEVIQIPEIEKWKRLQPICTVVIPCFNYGHFLKDAVNSALNQTLNAVEIIVVDDGSTDIETLNILQELMIERKVNVILKRNQGLSEARNTGIRAACGKYVCCLDADDILHPSYLEHCIYHLESDGMLGIVGSWVKLFGDENYVWKTKDFNIFQAMRENHTSVASVFRRSDWSIVGGYDSRMHLGYEDWEYWLRIGQLGRNGFVIKSPLFFHRRHGITMTHTANDKRGYLIEKKRSLNQKLFKDKAWQNKLSEFINVKDLHEPSLLKEAQKIERKQSILCILPWLKPGGAEELMLDILARLSKHYHITIVTTVDDVHEKLPEFLDITKDIFHFNEQTPLKDFSEFVKYLLETRKITKAFISGSELGYQVLPMLGDLRTVDLLHNNSSLGHIQTSIKYNEFLNGTICVSDVVLEDLSKALIPKHKLVTILNAVNGVDLFKPSIEGGEKGGDLKKPKTIGFVGRASNEKRPLLFLELCQRLNMNNRINVLMVCDGPMLQEVEEKIIELNLPSVEVIRSVNRINMPEVYRRMDILVNVSSVEGMPMTVIEALACGCPVAAMQVGNLSSLIEDGVNGFLAPQDNLNLLQSKLNDFISSEYINDFKFRARNSFLGMGLDINLMLDKYEANLHRFWERA